jgi:hypothetical protein
MDAAALAADWLISMQRPDGGVRSYLEQGAEGAPWTVSRKESTLYTGQVLSALSRMYRATREPKYLDAAGRTANYLAERISSKGCWMGDDYRKPNPISSSWAVMSLLDFVRASGDARFERLVFRCADELVGRQRRKPDDVYRYGRWQRSLSSSGTGWLAEVMSEVYLTCVEKGQPSCERFQSAVVAAIRLLLQYTYTPESAFVAKNPKAAEGGIVWSAADRYVRTDSVCHAMNAYLNLVDHLGEGPLVDLPERPLAQRLGLAGEGPGAADGEGADDERDEIPRLGPPPAPGAEDPAEEGAERGGPAPEP